MAALLVEEAVVTYRDARRAKAERDAAAWAQAERATQTALEAARS